MKAIEANNPIVLYRFVCRRCLSTIETTQSVETIADTKTITFATGVRCPICNYNLEHKQIKIGVDPTTDTAQERLMWPGEAETFVGGDS